MARQVTSAVFDTRAQAEAAVAQLRSQGISDHDISIIARHGDGNEVMDGRGDTISDGDGSGLVKGAGLGAGVGALAGVAALLIPGVGPFIAAGALIPALGVAGASVATGALAGAATGGLVGALTDYGVSDTDARYYEERLGSGGTVVAVDLTSAGMDESTVGNILYDAGGHNSTRAAGSAMSGTSDTMTTRTTTTTY